MMTTEDFGMMKRGSILPKEIVMIALFFQKGMSTYIYVFYTRNLSVSKVKVCDVTVPLRNGMASKSTVEIGPAVSEIILNRRIDKNHKNINKSFSYKYVYIYLL